MSNNILAVDIGGSKLLCGVLTPAGEILDTYRVNYAPGYTAKDLLAMIEEGYARLKAYPLTCCGAAIPGLCDPKAGKWLYSPFSGIGDIPIAKMLTKITGLPTYVDNDVNLCAMAEQQFGCCQDIHDFLWITVSNGIGGGLVLENRLLRGARMTAGEIGHIVVAEHTHRVCGCGKRGCLEAMASGASIASIYLERTGTALSAKEIAALARTGDKEAARIWQEAGAYIGKAAAHAVNLLGLDTVVLGGGAAQSFDLLGEPARQALEQFVFSGANPAVKLLHSTLGPYAALKGCAALIAAQKL